MRREATSDDTSKRADEVYFRRLAEMTPIERLAVGAALCQAGETLQRSAMRSRHPGADEREIRFRIAVTRFGEELARKAYATNFRISRRLIEGLLANEKQIGDEVLSGSIA